MIETTNFKSVEDQPDLKRDPASGAIINDNSAAYMAALERRRLNTAIMNRVEQIERDVSDIKAMFSAIIEKLDKR